MTSGYPARRNVGRTQARGSAAVARPERRAAFFVAVAIVQLLDLCQAQVSLATSPMIQAGECRREGTDRKQAQGSPKANPVPSNEETLLFLLIRLRNPRARVIYVTSQPLPEAVLDYYFQFLAGIPRSHAAARVALLSACDSSRRPLSEKVLERPRLLERIKTRIPNPDRAYLTILRSTVLERRLALGLGIQSNGAGRDGA
jgi:hypothetical protein